MPVVRELLARFGYQVDKGSEKDVEGSVKGIKGAVLGPAG